MNDIWKMYLLSFLRGAQLFAAVSIPFFMEWGKIDYTLIFILQIVFMGAIFLFQLPTGAFADRFGRKWSLATGFFLASLGFLIYSLAPDFWVFALGEITAGIGFAFMFGADKAFVFDLLKQNGEEGKARDVFAKIGAMGALGIVVAAPLGSMIAAQMLYPYPDNLMLPMRLSAIPMLLGGLVALTLREPKRTVPSESLLDSMKSAVAIFSKKSHLRMLSLDMTAVYTITWFIFWFYQPLLKNGGLDLSLWGFVAAAYNILAMLLLWKVSYIEKLAGTPRLLFLSALLPGLCFLAAAYSSSLLVALPAIFIITSLTLLRKPVFEHYLNFHIGSGERATVLSAVAMLENLLKIIIYLIAGFLADISLQYALLFLGISTLIFSFLLRSEEIAFEKGQSHVPAA